MIGSRLLNIGGDPDHDPDEEFLTEFLPLRDRGNCGNFCGISCLDGGLRSLNAYVLH